MQMHLPQRQRLLRRPIERQYHRAVSMRAMERYPTRAPKSPKIPDELFFLLGFCLLCFQFRKASFGRFILFDQLGAFGP